MRHDAGLETPPEHPEDCGCRECGILDPSECPLSHAHMEVGATCLCGFVAVPMNEEEARNEADFDELEGITYDPNTGQRELTPEEIADLEEDSES